jgi:hypothetical protein
MPTNAEPENRYKILKYTPVKFIDTKHWTKFKEANALLFLAQLLHEMLFDFTLDTYKPNALNVHSLIHEALDISQKISEGAIKEGNFEPVRDELQLSLSKDITLKRILKDKHRHYSDQIQHSKTHEELTIILHSLHYYLSKKKYFIGLKETLKELIIIGKSKSDIFSVTRSLITEILEYGYEKSFIYNAVKSTFFNNQKKVDSLDILDDFFNYFNFEKKKFKVTFICSPEFFKIKSTLKDFELKVMKDLKNLPKIPASEKFKKGNYQSCVYVIEENVEALDHAAARNRSEDKLKFITDLYSFYNHQHKFKIESNALVREISTGYFLNISRQTDAITKGLNHLPREIPEIVDSLGKNMSLDSQSLYKFTKAIQLHRLAINANELENQLLDLWAAVETLIPNQPHSQKNRIQLVVDYLSPVLSVNYMKKLISELNKDIEFWNKDFFYGLLERINGGNSSIEKLALIISDEKFSDLFNELDAQLNGFPLLKNRVGIYKQWCSNANEMQALLERHHKKVSWQIRRIYRARNSIIHNGEKPHQIEILVENLHSYLDSCIKGISDLIINKKGESVSQFFIETQILFTEHLEALRKNGSKKITEEHCKKLIFGIIE